MIEYGIVGFIVLLCLYCGGSGMIKDTVSMLTLCVIVVIVYAMVHVIIR